MFSRRFPPRRLYFKPTVVHPTVRPTSGGGIPVIPPPTFEYSARAGIATDRYGALTDWQTVSGNGPGLGDISGIALANGSILNATLSVYDENGVTINSSGNHTLFPSTGQNPCTLLYVGKLIDGNILLLIAAGGTFSTRSLALKNDGGFLDIEGRMNDNSIDSWATGLAINSEQVHFVGFSYDGTDETLIFDGTVLTRSTPAPNRKILNNFGAQLQNGGVSETYEIAFFDRALTEQEMKYYRAQFANIYKPFPAATIPIYPDSASTDFSVPTSVVTSNSVTHTAFYHFYDRSSISQNHSILGYTANDASGGVEGTEDTLAFSHIAAGGNFDLQGRFEWIGTPPAGARVGWGCRLSTTAPGSAAIYVLLGEDGLLRKVSRLANDAAATEVQNVGGGKIWLRLTRDVDLYSGYYSINGSDWNLLGPPVTNANLADIIGPVISGNGADCQAILSGVSLSVTTPPPPQPSTVTLDLVSTSGVEVSTLPDQLVTHWSDRSGQDNHVVDFLGTNKPVFRSQDDEVPAPAVEDRPNGYMQGPTGLAAGNQPRTLFFAIRPSASKEDEFLFQLRQDSIPSTSIQNAPLAVNSLAAFSVTISFSQGVTGFDVGDVTLGNAIASNFLEVNSSTYTLDVTPSTGADVTIDVAAAVAQSLAGQDNTAAAQVVVIYDATAPTVSISGAPVAVGSTAAIPLTAQFSEAVSGFEQADIVVTNSAVSNFVAVDEDTYTFDLTPTGAGNITINIPADSAQDVASSGNIAATQVVVIYDDVPPTIAIQGAPAVVNSTAAFSVTFEFDEDVTGFAVGDIALTNATAGNFVAVDGNSYTADITPTGAGNITIDVDTGAAQDIAGNDNVAATQVAVTYDDVSPTVTIQGAPAEISTLDPFAVTFQFSEGVTGFAIGDITLGNANASNFVAVDGDTYTADITPIAAADVTINVGAGVAQDFAGNGNSVATQVPVTYDAGFPAAGNDAALQAATLSVVGAIAGHTGTLTYNSPAAGVFRLTEVGAAGVGGHNLDGADEIVWHYADIAYPFTVIGRFQWDGAPPAGAQVGLTTRRQLTSSSHRHMSVYVDNQMNIHQAFRPGTAGANTIVNVVSATDPIWLRIDLNASGFTATTFYSVDGVTWIQIGAGQGVNVDSGVIAHVGFFTSGNGQNVNAIVSGVDIA